MAVFSVSFPDGFDDYEFEIEAKGYFSGAKVSALGKSYKLNFYDTHRLAQEIEDELNRGGIFHEPNLVVLSTVTRFEIERAVERMVLNGQFNSLVSE